MTNKSQKKRPEVLYGETRQRKTGCGKLYVTCNKTPDGRLNEVFVTMGKAGGCAASQTEAIGRLVSTALGAGVATEELIKQLKGISCHQGDQDTQATKSCADGIARVMEDFNKNNQGKIEEKNMEETQNVTNMGR